MLWAHGEGRGAWAGVGVHASCGGMGVRPLSRPLLHNAACKPNRELNMIIINDLQSLGEWAVRRERAYTGLARGPETRNKKKKKRKKKKRPLTVAPEISQSHGGGQGDGAREPDGEAGPKSGGKGG